MKKVVCILLAALLALSFCACRQTVRDQAQEQVPAETHTPRQAGPLPKDIPSSESDAAPPKPSSPADSPPGQPASPPLETPIPSVPPSTEEMPQAVLSTSDHEPDIDIDLTGVSSTIVYAEVYNMLYFQPEDYIGKTIKISGAFSAFQYVGEDGILSEAPVAYACVLSDAAACCAEGIEFILADGQHDPSNYFELDAEITVVGRFEAYEDAGMTWYRLADARIDGML